LRSEHSEGKNSKEAPSRY